MEQFGKAGARLIVLTNPHQGDFKTTLSATWSGTVEAIFAKYSCLIPAFKCGPATHFAYIESFLKNFAGRELALVYSNPSLHNAEIAKLIANSDVFVHVCLQGKMSAQQRALLPLGKAVDILDGFTKQERNADYQGNERFTDRHKTYKAIGIGFGDYTITGSLFQPGGGKVAAVAIHATYKNPTTNDIWMEHFVSDDTDIDTGSAASKYLEAAGKLVATVSIRKNEFGINTALADYANDIKVGHYPGLGKSKQRQIHHHIAVIHDILHGKL